ncbi:hypothetical protein [Bacillus sp. AR18-7]|uniref:hypothetical protein n=1 Tax=Bacillus sp. AR18-7 TaxID=2217821 RepID=UPI0011C98BF9|nr:hypothetical protein [Bacillus sp. AR18-7]TXR64486.1 hypothetical protein DN395_11125 [Bacillus sp. AR18-7]
MEQTITQINKEKMLYSLKVMNIATKLLEINNSSFFKRVVSRLIFMRIEDFIKFAKKYNNNLRNDGNHTNHSIIRAELNELEAQFVGSIAQIRHNFAGHFKLEENFWDQVEEWGTIEKGTLIYFYELTQKIIVKFQLPLENSFTLDPVDVDIFREISEKHNTEQKPSMSTDAVAGTRPNTGSLFFTDDLQKKSATLNTISLILEYEFDLLFNIRDIDVLRGLKMLLLVDLISFADNLFTRTTGHATHRILGLDTLVKERQLDAADNLMREAKQSTKILRRIEQVRQVRNKIGGHIDVVQPLNNLLERIDNIEANDIYTLFEFLLNILDSVFRSSNTLHMFLIRNQRLKGVLAVNNTFEQKGFEGQQYEIVDFEPLSYNYDTMTQMWDTLKTNINNEQSLSYFCDALMAPARDTKKEIVREIRFNESSISTQRFNYSSVEIFIERQLKKNRNNVQVYSILRHILHDSPIGPIHILSQMLLKEYNSIKNIKCNLIVLELLGFVSDNEEQKVIKLLESEANSLNFDKQFQSLFSLLKIDTQCYRITSSNNHSPSSINITQIILNNLEHTQPSKRIPLILKLLIHISYKPSYNINIKYYKETYFAVLKQILFHDIFKLYNELSIIIKEKGINISILDKIEVILDTCLIEEDFLLASIMLGNLLELEQSPKENIFYSLAAGENMSIAWKHPYFLEIQSHAYTLMKKFDEAYQRSEKLTKLYPCDQDYYWFALYTATGGNLIDEAAKMKKLLSNYFSLSPKKLFELTRC